tara:strand:+ start:2358 stop:3161 length:804 start_codon:yes stop_codon:yes gene_type:complete
MSIGKTTKYSSDIHDLRMKIRMNEWSSQTTGMAPQNVQTNLAVLPEEYAFDFLLYCQRNPQACPVIEVLRPGVSQPSFVSNRADIRTDLPKYVIYEHGKKICEVEDIQSYWRDDLVTFLIGCAFTFQGPLLDAGIHIRHLEEGRSDPTYITSIATRRAGIFYGPLVVSMWPVKWKDVAKVVQITGRLPLAHGSPVHVGDPKHLGIVDLDHPEYGEAVSLQEDEVPVFWACGVTPQQAAAKAKPSLMITHSSSHMFITDLSYRHLDIM